MIQLHRNVTNSQVYSNDEFELWPVYSGERFRAFRPSCLSSFSMRYTLKGKSLLLISLEGSDKTVLTHFFFTNSLFCSFDNLIVKYTFCETIQIHDFSKSAFIHNSKIV